MRAGSGDASHNGPIKYSVEAIEQLATTTSEESNLKQVEAKILDFDWVFNGNNASTFLSALGNTENDEIFACAQVRVFIEFLWQDYYKAIMRSLFIPFLFYFGSFTAYCTYFGHNQGDGLTFEFISMLCCLVIFGKTFFTFLILEIIQFRGDPSGYFFEFWNIVDFISLFLCLGFIIC